MGNWRFGEGCFRVLNGGWIMLFLGVCLRLVFNRPGKWSFMDMWKLMERLYNT